MGRYEVLFLVIGVVGALAFIPHGSIGEKDPISTEARLREVIDHMRKDFDNKISNTDRMANEFDNKMSNTDRMANEFDIKMSNTGMNRKKKYVKYDYQNPILTEALLREVVEHMGKDFDSASFMDYQPSSLTQADRHLALIRANKDLENEQLDYESLIDGNPRPSLRDREFLQHSSLMGHQYVTGGAGEGIQHLKPSGEVTNHKLVKSDDVMPAYCNPPNPCPVGYTEDQGCIIAFENTAAFSRDYQSSQRCMCDGEHMFSCPESPSDILTSGISFNEHHKGLVAKKFLPDVDINPFLAGERLPIAAKKGFDVIGF